MKQYAPERVGGEADSESEKGGYLRRLSFSSTTLVAIVGDALEVVEQLAAAGHQHEEAAAGRVIFEVRLEMVGQLVDPLGEERDLHIRAAGILLVHAERLEFLCFGHIF